MTEIDDWVYTGEDCIAGKCALCNPDHPGHEQARKELDKIFGRTDGDIRNGCGEGFDPSV